MGQQQYDELIRERDLKKANLHGVGPAVEQSANFRRHGKGQTRRDPGTSRSSFSAAESPTDPRREVIIHCSDRRWYRTVARHSNRRRERDEGHVAQESEGRASLHPDDHPGQHSAARKRFRGTAEKTSGLVRLDHGMSGRGDHHGWIGCVLHRNESLSEEPVNEQST